MNNHVKYDLCSIIVYTSFKSFDNGKMANCTSIVKFESDMKKLIDNGYEAISLALVDIFIATDLVGLNTYPGIENFIPHFSWEQANEMHRSGLVDIYAFWHPFDEKKQTKKQ